MKDQSKSKAEPLKGKSRTRLTLSAKREIIAMRKLGKSRQTIQEEKNIVIKEELWRKIWREKHMIENAKDNLKDFNLTHKVDSEIRMKFEKEVVAMVKEKSTEIHLSYELITLCCEHVRKEQHFRQEKELQDLLFTNCFITRFMVRHSLKFSARKSNQRAYTEEELKAGLE